MIGKLVTNALFPVVFFSNSLFAQISGLTYRDSNGNGKRENHVPAETILSGINVKAFDASDALISQTHSDATGRYTLDVPHGQSLRVVFGTGDEKGSLPPSRYVRSPARNIDFGLYNPDQHASPNPVAICPIYILGKGNDTLTALLAIATETGERTPLATAAQVGALWGVAYHRQTRQVYSAAFAKRHVGYGPLGTGGIYRTDWNTRQTTPWLNLKTLGIPTGIDRHKDLTAHPYGQNVDADMMSDVGTVSLGGMDILDNTLFVANLSDRQVYAIALPKDPSRRPGAADVKSYSLPDPGWKGGAVRPFAIKAYQGKLYVGVVCDAAESQLAADLKAGVYELDPISGKFRLVVTVPLAYSRGTVTLAWHPWTSDFTKARQPNAPSSALYPQPILSAIEFDADGGIILGLMDRFGHQAGTGQPDPTGEAAFSAIAAGDVLKVFLSRKNYKLEANAVAGDLRSAGAGNRQGPDGGEFFFEDGFVASDGKVIHEETAAGGLAWLPGTGELLASAHEPGSDFNNSGIKAFGNQTGKRTRSWAFYTDGQAGTFGKANGIGGIALVSEAPPKVLLGRIWNDQNRNGSQDVGEDGFENQLIALNVNDRLFQQAHTDANGYFSFSVSPSSVSPDSVLFEIILLRDVSLELTNPAKFEQAPDQFKLKIQAGNSVKNFHEIGLAFSRPFGEEGRPSLFKSYPNPFSRFLQFEILSDKPLLTVTLTDIAGRQIARKVSSGLNGKHAGFFDLPSLSKGFYLIKPDDISIPALKVVKE
ncbi:SdrD B-like domain-containing protein [Siphonobacter aquaeclarae]|uniref:Por secretion system C-terminal sorting domain-containing protein n=1 Tax=Siphonobacter aquaeclarae TaxID=563176 RepID=A0A1G9JT86_9BACT|nr:SdrD B-like domain-containing protein [Siphonobacter aquaeclarae]SDL40602.1 Por secretion system C-terminal sorting domain-containing protein [Siphonobacter aquaeclarae]